MPVNNPYLYYIIVNIIPSVPDAGDKPLFVSLEQMLVQAMPQEPTEWKRSYGRPIKSVFTEAMFSPFDYKQLPKEGDWHLIGQPIFHVFWTECAVSTNLVKPYLKVLNLRIIT